MVFFRVSIVALSSSMAVLDLPEGPLIRTLILLREEMYCVRMEKSAEMLERTARLPDVSSKSCSPRRKKWSGMEETRSLGSIGVAFVSDPGDLFGKRPVLRCLH